MIHRDMLGRRTSLLTSITILGAFLPAKTVGAGARHFFCHAAKRVKGVVRDRPPSRLTLLCTTQIGTRALTST
jgi:hypothetical protein